MTFLRAGALLALVAGTCAISSSYPHSYPGEPSGNYSPEWQSYFEVTDELPNVTYTAGRSYAGNLPVDRPNHENNTLFFWGFEKSNGSLTSDDNQDPWAIWIEGGPGASSGLNLFFGNGPIRINHDYSVESNKNAWSTVADFFWIDQPVGVGWSTADMDALAKDEDQVAEDFMGFLGNLVKVFPSLANRPLLLTGESYAGKYIPYITKRFFSMSNPPVKLSKIAIGNGAMGNVPVFEYLPTMQIIETYPQVIGYDPEAYMWFREQAHLCGFDLNLTYPQTGGKFPTFDYKYPTTRHKSDFKKRSLDESRNVTGEVEHRYKNMAQDHADLQEYREGKRTQWKRDLTGRTNGTIDPWYGCFLWDAMVDYATNYTYPWSEGDFSVMWIPDSLYPHISRDASVFMNDDKTRKAVHAPTSKDWIVTIDYEFAGTTDGSDPSPEPMLFLDELASNMTKHNLSMILYSGNDDAMSAHRGTEAIIQNTTFGGIQGFSKRPATPWYSSKGDLAGIIHQERGWTYILVKGGGHFTIYQQPESTLDMFREFIFGNNPTGSVMDSGDYAFSQGHAATTLAGDILPGQPGIYLGSRTTATTYFFPSATIAAWESFTATAKVYPAENKPSNVAYNAVPPTLTST